MGACGLRTSPGSQPSFPCRPASQPGGRGAGCAGSTAGRARSNLAARGGPAPLRQQWLLLPALDFPGFIFSQRLVTGLQSALGDRKPSQPPCAAASQGGKEPGFPGRPVAPVTGQVRVLFLLWAVASGFAVCLPVPVLHAFCGNSLSVAVPPHLGLFPTCGTLRRRPSLWTVALGPGGFWKIAPWKRA